MYFLKKEFFFIHSMVIPTYQPKLNIYVISTQYVGNLVITYHVTIYLLICV